MANPISDDRLEELIQAKMPRALHPLGHEGDCMSCDLVFALRELQERRAAVEPPAGPMERAFAKEPERGIIDKALRDIASCTCGDLWWQTAQKNHRPGCPLNRTEK